MLYAPARPAPKRHRRTRDYVGIVELEPAPLSLIGPPSSKLLIGLAARRWGVNEALLATPSRDPLVVAARHHAMWLLRAHRQLSLKRIGRLLGDCDHTTVLSGIARHVARMEGRVPAPFVWSPARVDNVVRFVRGGALLHEVPAHFPLSRTDLLRCPAYPRLKALAAIEWNYRMIERNQRARAE